MTLYRTPDVLRAASTIAKVGDGVHTDAFGRLRVSQNNVLFTLMHVYGANDLLTTGTTANGGTRTHRSAEASVRLELDGTANGLAIHQSKAYTRYLAGQGQAYFGTCGGMPATASVTARMGYYDADNGVYLEKTGSDSADEKICLRTSTSGAAVETEVARSSWNIDPFDGTGPSGKSLDLTASFILAIDLQWLGVGRVRVGFDIDGVLYPAHAFKNAGTDTKVYMQRGALPVRWELLGDAVATFDCICAAVNREGGEQDRGLLTTCHNALGGVAISTTESSILSARLNSSYVRAEAQPVSVRLINYGSESVLFRVSLNPTMASAFTTWVAPGGTGWSPYSALEQSEEVIAFNATPAGHVLAAAMLDPAAGATERAAVDVDLDSSLRLWADYSGTADIVTVSAVSASGTPNAAAAITFRELR